MYRYMYLAVLFVGTPTTDKEHITAINNKNKAIADWYFCSSDASSFKELLDVRSKFHSSWNHGKLPQSSYSQACNSMQYL